VSVRPHVSHGKELNNLLIRLVYIKVCGANLFLIYVCQIYTVLKPICILRHGLGLHGLDARAVEERALYSFCSHNVMGRGHVRYVGLHERRSRL
jgi:hypothetical protein